MFIDSHVHLEMREFDRDRSQVITRAEEAGIELMVTVGTTLADCRKAVSIAQQYETVYAAVGIHPHEVRNINTSTYDEIRKLAGHGKVVAYGEIGLDFFRNLSPRDVQINRFSEQLELALEMDLPVIIHNREAHRETWDALKNWPGKQGGIIHCFSGDYELAVKCIDKGFYISIPGTITFRKSEQLAEVVRKIPLQHLLVETDAPYLAPHPHRGKRNEPAFVALTAGKIAEIKNVAIEEVGRITSLNARKIFGKQNLD